MYGMDKVIIETKQCKNCLTPFQGKTERAVFCSNKCRLAFHRNNSSVSFETKTPKSETIRETILSKTDQLFQDDAIKRDLGDNWLAFSPITRNPVCNHCQKAFKTRLPMLRYCSPECRSKEMKGLVNA